MAQGASRASSAKLGDSGVAQSNKISMINASLNSCVPIAEANFARASSEFFYEVDRLHVKDIGL